MRAERTAARLVGRDLAEDVASEAMVRALLRWPRISGYAQAWITRVAVNLSIDLLRSAARRGSVATSASVSSFEGGAVDRLDMSISLARLPRRQRQTIVLHYLGGFSDVEVADILGLSVSTVKTHLGRALSRLRHLEIPQAEASDVSIDPA